MKNNTLFSYTVVTVAYLLAIYAAKLSLDFNNFNNIYYDMLVADIIATIIIFIFSILVNNSSMYDPYWSLIPIPIAYVWIEMNPDGNVARQLLVFSVIAIWGLRLTRNWIKTWPNLTHEDWRYRKLAEDNGKLYWPVSFLGIHLFPTLIVFAGMIPVYSVTANAAPLGLLDFLGAGIALAAVWIEYAADEQLRKFKKENAEPGANMELGLWSKTRHPNYFGEISFWLGLFVMALSGNAVGNLWTGAGFVAMVILFRFISIPMMEKRLLSRKKGYMEYMKSVPMLMPKIFSR